LGKGLIADWISLFPILGYSGSANLEPQMLQIKSTLESSSIRIMFRHFGHAKVFFFPAKDPCHDFLCHCT